MDRVLAEQKLRLVMNDYTDYLLKIAYLYVKDWPAAEDIVQDIFLKFYQNLDYFKERLSLKTYLTKITIINAWII